MTTALLTGINGTVAPCLARRLAETGIEVIAWDRNRVSPDDAGACERFFTATAPDYCVHLAMGACEWAGRLANLSASNGTRFLYTSSVSVFAAGTPAPISPEQVPNATDDYGRYKTECEVNVRQENPEAIIARLAWQVGTDPTTNNMMRYFSQQVDESGRLRVSSRWLPSSAWLDDTATALRNLLLDHPAGTYHIEANDGLSMYQIARRLLRRLSSNWQVEEVTDFQFDNRMIDSRLEIPSLSSRLA